jgi:hypothetical protein
MPLYTARIDRRGGVKRDFYTQQQLHLETCIWKEACELLLVDCILYYTHVSASLTAYTLHRVLCHSCERTNAQCTVRKKENICFTSSFTYSLSGENTVLL